jgi:hypothetical protein
MGRFVVTFATKVSRTAQPPASWAPLTGSCGSVRQCARYQIDEGWSYGNDEDASQSSASDDEEPAAEQDHQADLLGGSEA